MRATERQSVIDVMLQEQGSVNHIVSVCRDNAVALDDNLARKTMKVDRTYEYFGDRQRRVETKKVYGYKVFSDEFSNTYE